MNTLKIISFFTLLTGIMASPKRLIDDGTKTSSFIVKQGVLDEDFVKTMEDLITSLDEEQLVKIDAVLSQELNKFSDEEAIKNLEKIGLDQDHILDLKYLSQLMHDYLSRVEGIDSKLELSEEQDLMDNIQMYLLGAPNKLGPLGFFGLQHVLEDESYKEHHNHSVRDEA